MMILQRKTNMTRMVRIITDKKIRRIGDNQRLKNIYFYEN